MINVGESCVSFYNSKWVGWHVWSS